MIVIIGFSFLGCISFILFLIFYKKLNPIPFYANINSAGVWITTHGVISGVLLSNEFLDSHKEKFNLNMLIIIITYSVTGIIMNIIYNKLRKKRKKENEARNKELSA